MEGLGGGSPGPPGPPASGVPGPQQQQQMGPQSNMGNMGMRQPGMGGPPVNMGSMANPNQNMTLVNALAGKTPGQMNSIRGPGPPSSTATNSISDSNMTSMGGGGMPGQQVSMSPMTSMSPDLPNTAVSSMQAGQPNMMGGPMRPGMTMGGMGGGPGGPQTIMSSQMGNGPGGAMVRTVGGQMMGPGGQMNMIRQPGQLMPGQPRMINTGVRMPIRVRKLHWQYWEPQMLQLAGQSN